MPRYSVSARDAIHCMLVEPATRLGTRLEFGIHTLLLPASVVQPFNRRRRFAPHAVAVGYRRGFL